MEPLLLVLVLSIVVVAGALFLISRRSSTSKEAAEQREVSQPEPGHARRNRPNRSGRNRLIHARQVRNRRGDSDDEMVPVHAGDYDGNPNESLLDEAAQYAPKMGTKKLNKLRLKEEKQEQRRKEEEQREEKKKRTEEFDEARREKEREREEEEKRTAELERIRKQEEEERLDKEYQELRGMFSVDSEGVQQLDEEESQSRLQEFIAYIKESKVVMLEDLAAQFDLKTQDAIDRLQTFLSEGRLEGMMDDRGKFIYLTTEELEDVAKFIRQNGRVAISDLADASTNLINLKPASVTA